MSDRELLEMAAENDRLRARIANLIKENAPCVQKTAELSDEQIEEIADSTPVDPIDVVVDSTWWLRFARRAIAADRKLRDELDSNLTPTTSCDCMAGADLARVPVYTKPTEPVVYQMRTRRPHWCDWSEWKDCNLVSYEEYNRVPLNGDWVYQTRALCVIAKGDYHERDNDQTRNDSASV